MPSASYFVNFLHQSDWQRPGAVEILAVDQMPAEVVSGRLGQQCRPVLVAFPGADKHESLVEVEVLHSKLATL